MSSKSRSSARVGCAVIVGAIALLVVVVIIVMTVKQSSLDAKIAAIREAGEPTNLAELEDWIPTVPAADNAALAYLDAAATFQVTENRLAVSEVRGVTDESGAETQDPPLTSSYMPFFNKSEEVAPGTPISEATLDRIGRFLEEHAQTLAKLDDADALEAARYLTSYASLPSAKLEHLGNLRSLARLRWLQGVYHAERGDTEEATNALLGGIRIARSLDWECLLIAQLTQRAITRMNLQQLEFLLSSGSVPNSEIARIEKAIEELAEINTLSRALIVERAFFITAREETTPPGPLSLISTLDNNYYLDYMGDLIRIAKLPPPEMLAEADTLERQMNEDPLRILHVLSHIMVPALSRALTGEADDRVNLQLAIVACAIERYRNDESALPDDLDELSPEYLPTAPTDPYSGAPFRYQKLDEGYVLYSVGRNGVDDGGSDERIGLPNSAPSRADITFRVRR